MPLFRPYGSYVVSVAPVSVAVADVNGDEHLDLLVTNYMDDSVSVLLGYGGGGFTPVPVTGPGAYARQIVAGDLDGDGDIDYLAASLSGNSITVGLNTGNGIFVAGTSVVVHSGTRGVDLADLDGDGDLDFVSVNYDSDSLAVRLNNGDGTFATGAHLTTGGTRPVQIVIADFNADGIADLATTNSVNDTVGVLIGNGDATFAAPATFATGGQPRGITAADIDGDGFSDLLVTNFTGNSVSVLRNDGAGGFLPPVNYATGYQPYDVKVGDLDGDGDIDVVVSNSGTNSLSVLLNDGSGQFSQPAGSVIALGTSPAGLSLGDFDEDGDLDIATINYHLNSTTILLNRMATYSVSATSDDEGTAGNGGELVFTIARTATSEAEDVFLALTGTADANTDYTAPGGLTIRFAAGQGTATVRIAITADADVEADETVTLTLTATSGEGRISDIAGAATATIRNDDAINIAPSGADRTLTLLEDGSRALTVADFGFGDADGHALSAVRIAALPTAGALTLGGLAVTAGQSVSASAIAAGDLIYTPAPNQAGAAVAVLTFQVQDDGGTAQGGIDLDPTPNTITFNVTPVNDAPVLTGDLTAPLREGRAYTLTAADLGFTDPDDSATGVVFRASTPVHGALLVGGRAATSFTAADIAAGRVSFRHDGSEGSSASFRVQVEDGNEDGSTPAWRSFTFNVTPVNDAPVLTGDLTAPLREGRAYTLTAADLGFTDPDDNATGVVFRASAPVHGALLVGGRAATSFTAADIAAGRVSFRHDGSEGSSASFRIQVEDGNEDGSTPAWRSFTFNVTPVNDAPVLTGDLTAPLREGRAYTLTAADLGFTDPDDSATGVVFRASAPVHGALLVGGQAATSFTAADIAAGRVSFRHDGSEGSSASFRVQVEDGNEDGSTPAWRSFTFNVTPVNDAPVLTGDLTAPLREGRAYTLTAADLGFTDPDDSATGVVFRASAPVHGALLVGGQAATSFTAADIAAGRVSFRHDGSEGSSASFRVQVEDGNEDGSTPAWRSFTFNVTPVNDAPALKVTQIVSTLAEDLPTTAATKIATLAVLDPDGGANQLSIGGADAHLFEIRQGAVWLKAGAVLDHASNPVLDLVLLLDDPRIGTGPEAREALRIKLTAPPETLTGTEAHDRLTGTSAAETLDGRGGNDQLNGGAGNDILIGGTGTDLLRGGAGADTFVFTSPRDSAPGAPSYINNGDLNALAGAGARDIIQDFTKGQDVIDLSMMDTDRGQAGDQAFVWKGNGAFSHRTADLIYRQFDSTGTAHDKTVIYGDLDRDGRADFQIELTGLIDLSRGDFLL